ncbi:MAG: hypothetical protein OXI27_03535 [Thaumarchaeota archaeon]|nr:hypothetical protein [Nitrososphaerota archaeon]
MDTVKFLTCVAREQGRTEDEVDTLIDRIATWLEERTATDAEAYRAKMEEYVTKPLYDLKKLGWEKGRRMLEDWFVVDFHPEYKTEITDIVKFLGRTLVDSSEAINDVRNRDIST